MRRLVLSLVLSGLVTAGCGSGSSQTTTRGETEPDRQPPSRSDYLSVADAICANHRSRREALENQARELGPIGSERAAGQIARLLRQEGENRAAEIRELEGLEVPPADAAALASMLRPLRDQLQVIDEWARAYDELDSGAIRRLQIRLGAITSKADRRARAYGFDVCGRA